MLLLVTCEHPSPAQCVCLMSVGICVFLLSLPPTHSQECLSNLWSSSGQESSNIFLLSIDNCKCTASAQVCCSVSCYAGSSWKEWGGRTRFHHWGRELAWKQTDGHKEALLLTQTLERAKQYNVRDMVDDPAMELKQHGLHLTVCVLLEQ